MAPSSARLFVLFAARCCLAETCEESSLLALGRPADATFMQQLEAMKLEMDAMRQKQAEADKRHEGLVVEVGKLKNENAALTEKLRSLLSIEEDGQESFLQAGVSISPMERAVFGLTRRVDILESSVDILESRTRWFQLSNGSVIVPGLDFLVQDANLRVFTSDACSDAAANGRGNLVVGNGHSFRQAQNGFVAGASNSILGCAPSVSGGTENQASATASSVSGGRENTAEAMAASVSGGFGNTAAADSSSVTGGQNGAASAFTATISGGANGVASGLASAVSGGTGNTASNSGATVTGGQQNIASAAGSSVTGGAVNEAGQNFASVSGGRFNTAEGFGSSILGGTNVSILGFTPFDRISPTR